MRAIWHPEPRSKGAALRIVVEHLPLARGQRTAVEAEVARAGRFWLRTGRGGDVDLRLVAIAG